MVESYKSWDQLDTPRGRKQTSKENRRKVRYIKLVSGTTSNVRPVGEPVFFYEFVHQKPDGKWASAVCESDENGPLPGNPIAVKYNLKPSFRGAINVIDRSDGQISILKGPKTIFDVFKSYRDMTEQEPGGPNGADFSITKSGAGRETRYTTKKTKVTPFTQSEIDMINSPDNGQYNLREIFRAVPNDVIEKRLFGISEEEESSISEPSSVDSQSQQASKPQQQREQGKKVDPENIPF